MVILPSPFVTSEAIASVLRPGAKIHPDSALKTLQRNGLNGHAVSVVQRSGATARGRAVFYSALMLDVARHYRRGDIPAARRARDAGDQLVSGRPARFVAEALAADLDASLEHLDQVSGGAMSRLAFLTEARHLEAYKSADVPIRWAGTVVDSSDGVTTIRTSDGPNVAIPGTLPKGTPVVVDIERSDAQAILAVRAGLKTTQDPNSRTPSEPIFLTRDDRETLEHGTRVLG
jgi:hypothetical protein